ncbi:unnamed protein product [Ranitomeya imitator]|uniref:Uncharacterized protein n=1 Tax=Ranitomeya imitator TaxID=111125 RepID=A0ABN9MJV4_9NEOB|nr:unnamed protein product [Ranitomeya imitator]
MPGRAPMRQSQYLMYRRLFMDIEREQVKETRRQKEHERKISKMKHDREVERLMEEQRLRVSAFPRIQRQSSESEETEQEATAEEEKERVQKTKDCKPSIDWTAPTMERFPSGKEASEK